MSGYARRLATAQPERKRTRSDDEVDEEEELQSFLARSTLKEREARRLEEREEEEKQVWFTPQPMPMQQQEMPQSIAEQLAFVRHLQREHYLRLKVQERRLSPMHPNADRSPGSGGLTGSLETAEEEEDERSRERIFLQEQQQRNTALFEIHTENALRRQQLELQQQQQQQQQQISAHNQQQESGESTLEDEGRPSREDQPRGVDGGGAAARFASVFGRGFDTSK